MAADSMHRGTWAWRREEWRCINSITASKPPAAHPLITFQKLRVAAEDAGGASGFTRCSGAQVQHHVILLPHGLRDRRSTCLFTRSKIGRAHV